MLSKNLNPLQRFQHLLETLPFDCVFDGEVCALDENGRPQFNDLLFGRGEPVYVVFDLLFYEGEDIRSLPLKERRAILDQVAERYGLQKSELFIGCGKSLFKSVCEMDLEGIVAKKLSDPYSPSTHWFKILNSAYSQKERRLNYLRNNHGCIALFFPSAGHSLASGRLRYPAAGQGDLKGLSGRVLHLPHSFKRPCRKARETRHSNKAGRGHRRSHCVLDHCNSS